MRRRTTFTGWTSGSVRRCSAARWSWTWPSAGRGQPLTGSIFWRWPRHGGGTGCDCGGHTAGGAGLRWIRRRAAARHGGALLSYYREAYGAALGCLAGHFAIRHGPADRRSGGIPAYGLKAFSPIAAGYPWSHYRTSARSAAMMRGRTSATTSSVRSARPSALWRAARSRRSAGTATAAGASASAPTTGSAYYYAHLRKDTPYAEGLAVGQRCRRARLSALWAARAIPRRRTSTISRRCTCISACN